MYISVKRYFPTIIASIIPNMDAIMELPDAATKYLKYNVLTLPPKISTHYLQIQKHRIRGQAVSPAPYPDITKKHETGFEPAALALARRCSTTEPLVHFLFRTYEV